MLKKLLLKMVSAVDENEANSFDSTFYIGYDNVLAELENNGYIVKSNDIMGSISLTEAGYTVVKK